MNIVDPADVTLHGNGTPLLLALQPCSLMFAPILICSFDAAVQSTDTTIAYFITPFVSNSLQICFPPFVLNYRGGIELQLLCY